MDVVSCRASPSLNAVLDVATLWDSRAGRCLQAETKAEVQETQPAQARASWSRAIYTYQRTCWPALRFGLEGLCRDAGG